MEFNMTAHLERKFGLPFFVPSVVIANSFEPLKQEDDAALDDAITTTNANNKRHKRNNVNARKSESC